MYVSNTDIAYLMTDTVEQSFIVTFWAQWLSPKSTEKGEKAISSATFTKTKFLPWGIYLKWLYKQPPGFRISIISQLRAKIAFNGLVTLRSREQVASACGLSYVFQLQKKVTWQKPRDSLSQDQLITMTAWGVILTITSGSTWYRRSNFKTLTLPLAVARGTLRHNHLFTHHLI
jgi:hypothetical protein